EDDLIEQLDKLLTSRSVSWLFGAGISGNAGVPLMWPLTQRVMDLAAGGPHEGTLSALQNELPPDSHVEHLLSYLADHIAIAQRSVAATSTLGGNPVGSGDLIAAHQAVLNWISETVRWGYVPGPPALWGERGSPQ